jgi:hypothetical protein
MSQQIDNAMSEHPHEEGHRRLIEHRGQGEAETHNDKRMHGDRDGMQRRVVQEHMEGLDTSGLRHDGAIVGHKTQRYEYIRQDAAQDGEPLFMPGSFRIY